jgi:hypothetical protein
MAMAPHRDAKPMSSASCMVGTPRSSSTLVDRFGVVSERLLRVLLVTRRFRGVLVLVLVSDVSSMLFSILTNFILSFMGVGSVL